MRVKNWLQATVCSLAVLSVVYAADSRAAVLSTEGFGGAGIAALTPILSAAVGDVSPAITPSSVKSNTNTQRTQPVTVTHGLIDTPTPVAAKAIPKVVKIEPSMPEVVADVPLTEENMAPRVDAKSQEKLPIEKTTTKKDLPAVEPVIEKVVAEKRTVEKPVPQKAMVEPVAPSVAVGVTKEKSANVPSATAAPNKTVAEQYTALMKTSQPVKAAKQDIQAVSKPPEQAVPTAVTRVAKENTTNVPSAMLAPNKTVAEQYTALMATSQPVPAVEPSSPSSLIPSGGEVSATTGPAAAAVNKTPDAKEEASFRVATSQAAVSPPPPVISNTSSQVGTVEEKTASEVSKSAPVDISIISSAHAQEKLKDLPLAPEKNDSMSDLGEALAVKATPATKLKDLPKIPVPAATPAAAKMEDLQIKTRDNMKSPEVQSTTARTVSTGGDVPPPSTADTAKQTARAMVADAKKQASAPLINALPVVHVNEDPATVATNAVNAEAPKETLSPATQAILDKLPTRLEKQEKTKKSGPVAIQRERKSEALSAAEESSSSALGINVSKKSSQVDMGYELEQAYNAMVAGNTEIAISKYQQVLDSEPSNQDAIFGLATCYHRIGRLERARPLYGKLLAINPSHREALNNFLLMMSEEAPNEALQRLKEMQAANPSFAPIPAQMALVYEKLGDMRGAVDAMRDAISLEGDNLLYRYNLAILYDKMGALEEAMHAYRYVVEAAERGQDLPGDIMEMKKRLDYITLKLNTQKASDAKG